MPRTKQMASRMLDFPDPFRPVTALKDPSKPEIAVRTGYDLVRMSAAGRRYREGHLLEAVEDELRDTHRAGDVLPAFSAASSPCRLVLVRWSVVDVVPPLLLMLSQGRGVGRVTQGRGSAS